MQRQLAVSFVALFISIVALVTVLLFKVSSAWTNPSAAPPVGSGVGTIPAGQVAFFNLASCPSGWTDLTAIYGGRYVVAKPSAGTLAGTVGTALTNQENRAVGQHNHGITDPGHNHDFRDGNNINVGGNLYIITRTDGGGVNTQGAIQSRTTGISINNAGSVAGTNAPYVQLLACQKS